MTQPLLTSRADISIDRPHRWAKQLVTHLSRNVPSEQSSEGDVLTIGGGKGIVHVHADKLVLRAVAPDAEALAHVEGVLARHLHRFARQETVNIVWIR